jgi:hypothetical protein
MTWGLLLTLGFGFLASYQARAGVPAKAPDAWPAAAGLPFDGQRQNLVMFAHPKCPCSDASLEELKIALTQARAGIRATVCFVLPAGLPAEWADTGLFRNAQQIPGLHVVVDRDGVLARNFGAMTSGQVLLFDGEGRRLFSGGITGARGEAGPNRGRLLLVALARGERREPARTPVFGCALHEAETRGPAAAAP